MRLKSKMKYYLKSIPEFKKTFDSNLISSNLIAFKEWF